MIALSPSHVGTISGNPDPTMHDSVTGDGVMRRPEDHLVSRVREIRMHGLNGVLLTSSPRLKTSRIYQ